MIATKQQRRRDRKKADPASPVTRSNAGVTGVSMGADTQHVVIHFTSPVTINAASAPQTWRFGTSLAVITGVSSGNGGPDITCSLNTAVAAAESFVMGANDPQAKSGINGLVNGAAGAIAA